MLAPIVATFGGLAFLFAALFIAKDRRQAEATIESKSNHSTFSIQEHRKTHPNKTRRTTIERYWSESVFNDVMYVGRSFEIEEKTMLEEDFIVISISLDHFQETAIIFID